MRDGSRAQRDKMEPDLFVAAGNQKQRVSVCSFFISFVHFNLLTDICKRSKDNQLRPQIRLDDLLGVHSLSLEFSKNPRVHSLKEAQIPSSKERVGNSENGELILLWGVKLSLIQESHDLSTQFFYFN